MTRFKESREKAGLTQKEAALSLDVSVQAVSYWETGSRMPSVEKILQMCDLYNVTADYLLGRTPMEVTAIQGEAPPPEQGRFQLVFGPGETPTPDELEARILSALQNQLPDLVRQEIQNQQKKG